MNNHHCIFRKILRKRANVFLLHPIIKNYYLEAYTQAVSKTGLPLTVFKNIIDEINVITNNLLTTCATFKYSVEMTHAAKENKKGELKENLKCFLKNEEKKLDFNIQDARRKWI